MTIKIITKQLADKLPKNSKLKTHIIVNPKNFNQLYNQLTLKKIQTIHITDITKNNEMKQGTIFPIKDHINRTGKNILMGKQKQLGIDFIDSSTIYTPQADSIITDCCGSRPGKQYKYPSKYICHITTLACALDIKIIYGFLYNIV